MQSKYILVNTETGEREAVDLSVQYLGRERWQRVYVSMLSAYFDLAGTTPTKFLSYLLANKDGKNVVHGTYLDIAGSSGVSVATVKRLMPELITKGFVRKVGRVSYMVNPEMICDGGKTRGVVLMKEWMGADK